MNLCHGQTMKRPDAKPMQELRGWMLLLALLVLGATGLATWLRERFFRLFFPILRFGKYEFNPDFKDQDSSSVSGENRVA